MLCPACNQELKATEIEINNGQKAVAQECFNCGGHFLPPLIANFLTQDVAKNLDSIEPKNLFPSNKNVICPICQANLTAIGDDSVPRGVTIYACPNAHGHFFPKNQLISFKKAQKNKLEYHQIWGIPLASIFAILLPVTAIFTAISVIPATIQQLNQKQENRLKASDVISRPLVTPVNTDTTIISFTTETPSTAEINLNTPTGAKTFSDTINPQTTHVITLTGLTPNTSYTYTVTINKVVSDLYSFTTPNADQPLPNQ